MGSIFWTTFDGKRMSAGMRVGNDNRGRAERRSRVSRPDLCGQVAQAVSASGRPTEVRARSLPTTLEAPDAA